MDFDPDVRQRIYQQALKQYGSRRKLALALEISPSAVYQWDGVIPWDKVEEVQNLIQTKPVKAGGKNG